jgi:hypothetical protein
MLVKVEDCCRDAFVMRIYHDDAGDLFLGRGWAQFSDEHHLNLGDILFFTFDGRDFVSVKVFSVSRCRVMYDTSGAAVEAARVPEA